MRPAYKRGEVYWTQLDPVIGREQSKTRPCAILSDTLINEHRGTVVIVPLTSTPQREQFPILIAMPSMGKHTKSRTEQIRSVDKSRLGKLVGILSEPDMQALSRAVATVLKLA